MVTNFVGNLTDGFAGVEKLLFGKVNDFGLDVF